MALYKYIEERPEWLETCFFIWSTSGAISCWTCQLHLFFILIWGVEMCKLVLVWKWFGSSEWRIFYLWPLDLVKSNIPVLHSLQNRMCQKSIKYWVFDDPSHIKRSFWCQGWWKHQAQYFFWWNEGEEVIEATEAVEAVEAIEAVEVLKPEKSSVRTWKSSRLLNSALFWCFENIFFGGRIMKYQVEF